ncbi:glucosamine-fructose-6-phosphate aminotransferase [Candidatus Saccharibacteria bacterium RAAC3_TM7_1]|nr:glucosamine-fructose-6-phosphate aminotransferase [Candidatus Saccharibacteria bacterium RAAC3_TM7_1]
MCGIVGYIGHRNAQEVLVNGLKRLEYRGYDSAGVVTFDGGDPQRLRATGKVEKLAELVRRQPSDATVGIGHTRWATHGVPSETNAHPHHSGDIYLVHNGIIENYREIKAELPDVTFQTETDSEVLAALINDLYQREDVKLENAVTQALKVVTGTYGIAVMSPKEPGKIVAARLGSPLLIGISEGETFIASDAAAIMAYTKQVIYLNDGELAVCTAGDVDVRDLASQPVSAKVETIEGDLQAIQKGGYDHYLLKEIMEQPESLRSTLRGRVIKESSVLRLGGLNMSDDELRSVKHIFIIACGTASYAGMVASYYLEDLMDDITVHVEVASEFRYRHVNVPDDSLALFVSQSGETADTLACLKEMKRRGVRCIGVINAVGSTIAREVDGGVYVHAGPEISVASTKAFTSQVTALLLIGLVMAQTKGLAPRELARYIDELDALPDEIERLLQELPDEVKRVAKQYEKYDHAIYLGRGPFYPTALEGALKLKETSYVHAEGQAAGELKHGSIALIDDRFFEVAFIDKHWLIDKMISNVTEVKTRGGHIIAVTNSDNVVETETEIKISSRLELLTPLLFNVISQLFAYYTAVARGNDVDQPRNLAKSVTVE